MKAYFLSSTPTAPRVQCIIDDYCASLRKKTDGEIKDIVESERNCRGWCSQRSYYLIALRQVCGERGLEFCWSNCDV